MLKLILTAEELKKVKEVVTIVWIIKIVLLMILMELKIGSLVMLCKNTKTIYVVVPAMVEKTTQQDKYYTTVY